MAETDLKIKDAPLSTNISGNAKMAGSDGSGLPVAISLSQIYNFVNSGLKGEAYFAAKTDVPEWAKQPNKPTYTASEVGALSEIPQATSEALGGIKVGYTVNDKNYPVQIDEAGKAYVNVPWIGKATPVLASAPTEDTLTYMDSIGGTVNFEVGQSCVYPSEDSADGWYISFLKAINDEGKAVWERFDAINIATENANNAATLAKQAAEAATELNDHPWIIQQGIWYKWNTDTDQYESTGLQAKGDTGASFNIVGIYPTVDDLKAAVPDGTDVDGVYAVGNEAPYHYYSWTYKNGEWGWVDQGVLMPGDEIYLTESEFDALEVKDQDKTYFVFEG